MLYTQTVDRRTFELLKTIMSDTAFNAFSLAGGTALSLMIGHRKSIDLDMFTTHEFNPVQLEKYLQQKYAFRGDFLEGFSLKGEVKGVKLDFIRHDYTDVEPRKVEDGIRLYGFKDIAAMKLSAIGDNGTRLKDFIDIAYLSEYLTFNDMLEAFKIKYPQTNPYRAVKGLTYFQDIKFNEQIDLLGRQYRWTDIEKRLVSMTQEENKRFPTLLEKPKQCLSVDTTPKKRGRKM